MESNKKIKAKEEFSFVQIYVKYNYEVVHIENIYTFKNEQEPQLSISSKQTLSMSNLAKVWNKTSIPTCKKGTNHIDGMSVSNPLLHDISHFTMHPYDHVTSYDHRSIHLEIKLKKYFRKNHNIYQRIPQGIYHHHKQRKYNCIRIKYIRV